MSNLELLGKKREPHNVIRAEVQRSGEHVAAASIIGVHIVRSVGTRASNEGSQRLREDFTINDISDRLVSIVYYSRPSLITFVSVCQFHVMFRRLFSIVS